jgi:hypothetical protein
METIYRQSGEAQRTGAPICELITEEEKDFSAGSGQYLDKRTALVSALRQTHTASQRVDRPL